MKIDDPAAFLVSRVAGEGAVLHSQVAPVVDTTAVVGPNVVPNSDGQIALIKDATTIVDPPVGDCYIAHGTWAGRGRQHTKDSHIILAADGELPCPQSNDVQRARNLQLV